MLPETSAYWGKLLIGVSCLSLGILLSSVFNYLDIPSPLILLGILLRFFAMGLLLLSTRCICCGLSADTDIAKRLNISQVFIPLGLLIALGVIAYSAIFLSALCFTFATALAIILFKHPIQELEENKEQTIPAISPPISILCSFIPAILCIVITTCASPSTSKQGVIILIIALASLLILTLLLDICFARSRHGILSLFKQKKIRLFPLGMLGTLSVGFALETFFRRNDTLLLDLSILLACITVGHLAANFTPRKILIPAWVIGLILCGAASFYRIDILFWVGSFLLAGTSTHLWASLDTDLNPSSRILFNSYYLIMLNSCVLVALFIKDYL